MISRRDPRCILLACGLAACTSAPTTPETDEPAAAPTSRTTIAYLSTGSVLSAKFEHWERGDDKRLRVWSIDLPREEIDAWGAFLRDGELLAAPPGTMFTTSMKGEIATLSGSYEVAVGYEKIADQTVRMSLQPIEPKNGRTTTHIRASREVGWRLLSRLDGFLREQSRNMPPTKIERW